MRGPAACRVAVGVAGALGCVVGDRHWKTLDQWGAWPLSACGVLLAGGGIVWLTSASRSDGGYRWLRPAAIAVVLLAAFGVTAGRGASARAGVERGAVARLAGSGIWVEVLGRVASEVEASAGSVRFSLRLSEVRTGQGAQRVHERLTVVIPNEVLESSSDESLSTGVEIEVEGLISEPDQNYRDMALRSRSLGSLRARHFRISDSAPRWLGSTTAVRKFLRSGAEASLDAEQSGLLLGLMYGDTQGLSQEGEAVFRRAGLSHLTAVSGQNFALVMGAIAALIRAIPALWYRRRLRTGILIAVALWFVGLTRWEPSVLRAGAMAIVLLLALSAGIRPSFAELISIAGLVALIGDPMLVFSVGFQLSIAATMAIAHWAVPLSASITSRMRIPKVVVLPAAVALAAEMGVAPLIAAHFGTIQLLSVPANLLAVPVAGFVSVWGYVACAVSAAIPPLRYLMHLGTELPLWWLRRVAEGVGGLEVAEIEVGRPPWTAVVLVYLSLAVSVRLVTSRTRMDRDPTGKKA